MIKDKMKIGNFQAFNFQKPRKLNKRGMNAVIAMALIVILSMAGVFILYYNFNKTTVDFGDEVSCFDLMTISPSFFINTACYLDSSEILVDVERKSDVLDLTGLKFAFFAEQNTTRWQITGKKCSNIRVYGLDRYGGYCNLPKQDDIVKYVFNISDLQETQKQVKMIVSYIDNGRELSCLIDQKTIEDGC